MAILAGASGQIRNMASNGGNINQRTRCSYFYDVAMPCNKREPGTGCGALEGINRMHAIFGWSKDCVAVMPSDMAIALAALDAVVKVQGKDGKERSIPFIESHRLPENTPAAIVQQGTTPHQRVICGNLATLPGNPEVKTLQAPTLIIIGGVVSLRQKLSWFKPGS